MNANNTEKVDLMDDYDNLPNWDKLPPLENLSDDMLEHTLQMEEWKNNTLNHCLKLFYYNEVGKPKTEYPAAIYNKFKEGLETLETSSSHRFRVNHDTADQELEQTAKNYGLQFNWRPLTKFDLVEEELDPDGRDKTEIVSREMVFEVQAGLTLFEYRDLFLAQYFTFAEILHNIQVVRLQTGEAKK